MDGRRWGRASWLAAWALVAGAQIVVIWLALQEGETADYTPFVLGVLALQVLKVPITLPRLNDLGRPPDDVIFALVPLLNWGLFLQIVAAKTPAQKLRERRIRSWSSQLSTLGAYREGWRALVGSASKVLFPTLLLGVTGAALAEGLGSWLVTGSQDPAVMQHRSTLFAGGTALVLLYTLIQVGKRRTASVSSWLPSLALLPLLLCMGSSAAAGLASPSAGLIIYNFYLMAADMAVWPLFMGVLVMLWVREGFIVLKPDAPAPIGSWSDVTVIWGARAQAVAVGAQILIPGIYLSVIYAFSDLITVLQPERPAFSRSSQLASGIYNKLFQMLTIWFIAVVVIDVVVLSPWVEPAAVIQTILGIGGTIAPEARAASAMLRVLASWWCVTAMLAVFLERDRLMDAHEARKAAAAAS